MRKSRIDRRVDRTRTLLQNALLSLIQTKSYEAITVKDICEAANVGRSSFYAHYTSKDDLKRSGIDRHLRKLLAARQNEARATSGTVTKCSFGFSLAMFEHARDHKEVYRALAGGQGAAIALGTIQRVLSDFIRQELARIDSQAPSDAQQKDVTVQFLAGAYMAVLTSWLDGGAKLLPEKVDAMFRALATRSVQNR